MIPNQGNFQVLTTGVNTRFKDYFKRTETDWQKVATKLNSNTKVEEYNWATMFPRMKKLVGERIFKSIGVRGYQIQNEVFSSAIRMTLLDMETDQFAVVNGQSENAGYEAKVFPDRTIFGELLPSAFTTGLCYDGTPFVGANHVVKKGCTKSNLLAAAGFGDAVDVKPWFLIDASRPIKPFIMQELKAVSVDFIGASPSDVPRRQSRSIEWIVEWLGNFGFGMWQMCVGSTAPMLKADGLTPSGAFSAAYDLLMSQTDPDEGNRIGLKPTHLIVGPSNRVAAEKNVLAENLVGFGSNTEYKKVELVVTPWLD